MSDARTEARRRLVEAIEPARAHRFIGQDGYLSVALGTSEDIADAVLKLFPYVEWQPWCMSHGVAVQYSDRSDCDGLGPHDEGRELVLHAGIDDLAWEATQPVVPEEPRDA